MRNRTARASAVGKPVAIYAQSAERAKSFLDMGAKDGANEKMSDQMKANGAKIYPVSLAAEKAWEAAHGEDIQVMVGAEAERARFMTRWLPGLVRKQIKAGVPPRG